MRKIIIFSILAIAMHSSQGQVLLGTGTPDASAALQVDATNKGFLAPRVTLTSYTDVTTISAPATGLLVYCTGSTILSNGFYYWNGTKWTAVSNLPNASDVGYILGWGSNATPPNYMLPLSGGTYSWADYPEFQAFHTATPSQLIASSNGTTFTLVDLNGGSRFIRGGATVGTQQSFSTAAPSTAFALGNAGGHSHSVDPPATATNNTGSHQHNLSFHNDDWNGWGGGNASLEDDAGGWYTRVTDWGGSHAHTIDIGAFTSAAVADHTHTITGGDAETRPINTSVVWCIKVKPTSTSGRLTIINQASPILAANNGVTHSGAQEKLGGSLIQNTTIAQAGNDLGFTGGEVGIGTSSPGNKLEVNSGAAATSGVRLTQVTNAAQLGTNASGDVYSVTPNYVTAQVNAGVPVTLGNIKVQCSTAGNRSLQYATTSGTISVIGSDEAVYASGGTGSYGTYSFNATLGTSWTQFVGYNFPWVGNVQRVIMTDVTNGITYRIMMIIGAGYNNNLIKIEKLNG